MDNDKLWKSRLKTRLGPATIVSNSSRDDVVRRGKENNTAGQNRSQNFVDIATPPCIYYAGTDSTTDGQALYKQNLSAVRGTSFRVSFSPPPTPYVVSIRFMSE